MKLPTPKRIYASMRDKDGRLKFAALALIGVSTVLLCAFIAIVFVFPSQAERRAALEKERELKQRQLDELKLQKEFLQELSSLSESSEYLIRYLRETQGYIMNGDIRLDLTDPNAVIPTPLPTGD